MVSTMSWGGGSMLCLSIIHGKKKKENPVCESCFPSHDVISLTSLCPHCGTLFTGALCLV